MGLGKTVEIAALILSRPAPPLQTAHQTTADGLLISRYDNLPAGHFLGSGCYMGSVHDFVSTKLSPNPQVAEHPSSLCVASLLCMILT